MRTGVEINGLEDYNHLPDNLNRSKGDLVQGNRTRIAGGCVAINMGMLAAVFVIATSASPLPAATFTVTTSADSGAGSLRQAILDANSVAGVDTIDFAIPAGQCSAGGVCTITLATSLPAATEAVLLDGTTQPRYGSAPDNVCAGSDAPSYMRVLITSTADFLLEILDTAEPTTIRGLAFTGDYPTMGIRIHTVATTRVQCNHFGLNGEGTTGIDLGRGIGLHWSHSGGGAIIGTDGDGVDDVAERNVFGSVGQAIYINAGSSLYPSWIAGNYFGFGADGTSPMDSSQGVYMRQSAAGNLVGSNLDGISDELEHNVMGNLGIGVFLEVWSGVDYVNHVVGNWIGVDARGRPAPNDYGIRVSGEARSQDIRANQIHSNSIGILIRDNGSLATAPGQNCIARNSTGLQHEGTEVALYAENNYWGAADGPSGVGPGSGDSIVEASTGTVDYDPWLTSPVGVCTIVFVDGFESGDTTAWSNVVP